MADQRMKEYKISSFADLMQALQENPKWLRKLRRMILTQELLRLPQKFAEFRREVKEKLDNLEKEVREIKEKLDKDVWPLKGMWLEMKVRESVLSFFSEHFLDAKVVDQEEINKVLLLAVEKRVISKEEREDVLRLDLIIEGTPLSKKEPVFVAVEVSYRVWQNDAQRAVKRAEILEKAMGRKTLPAVVGYEISKSARKLIRKKGGLNVLISE